MPVAVMVPAVTVLSALPRFTRRGTGFLLAVAHTGLMLAAMAAAPLWILSDPEPMYANVYAPYFLVPGPHIWVPSAQFFGATVAPWLDEFLAPRAVGVLCIVVGPGLVGLLVGGAQWYLIGAAWDRFDRFLPGGDAPA
jgi:hypothetical protein